MAVFEPLNNERLVPCNQSSILDRIELDTFSRVLPSIFSLRAKEMLHYFRECSLHLLPENQIIAYYSEIRRN